MGAFGSRPVENPTDTLLATTTEEAVPVSGTPTLLTDGPVDRPNDLDEWPSLLDRAGPRPLAAEVRNRVQSASTFTSGLVRLRAPASVADDTGIGRLLLVDR